MLKNFIFQVIVLIGQFVLSYLNSLGQFTILAFKSIACFLKSGIPKGYLVPQLKLIGIDSLPIVSFTAMFTGMVLVVQVGNQFMNLGAENIIGGVVGLSLSREMSPLIVAVILAARIGSSMAAEIGTMKVTEQIDAMRILGANPIQYLVIPRVLACMLFTPILVVYSNLIGILGGYLVAIFQIGANKELFIQSLTDMVSGYDFISGLIKSIGFGLIIALIGCYKGLNTKGGARGVGHATTSSVVLMITSILVTNYFFSLIFFAWLKARGSL